MGGLYLLGYTYQAQPETPSAKAGQAYVVERPTRLEAAARQPPNYFLAGSVTGACFHCHSPVVAR